MPGNCTQADKDKNRAEALKDNVDGNGNPKPDKDKKKYHPDVPVLIKSVEDGNENKQKITFTAPGSDQPHTALWHRNKRQVWAGCPSTLPSKATAVDNGPLPAVDAEGTLYLERKFVDAEAKAGRPIVAERPKWPEELGAGEDVKDLRVTLTNLVVSGVERATGQQFQLTFDLMDPALGGAAQAIVYDAMSKTVTLSLTRKAFEEFHAPFEDAPKPKAPKPKAGGPPKQPAKKPAKKPAKPKKPKKPA